MNLEQNQYKESSQDYNFEEYDIEVLEDGSINGPKRPEQYAKTPKFTYKDTSEIVLGNEKDSLSEYFEKPFSVCENQKVVLTVVDKIVKEIVGKSFKDFANIIIMSEDDFLKLRKMITKETMSRGIEGDYHGINLGGLIISQDTNGNNCFPLLFHEIGHNMYPDEHDNYLDEFRAMYFQILCTKKLENELSKIGINTSYPDDYYKEIPLPTDEHRKAYEDARALFTYQLHYDAVVKGSERAESLENKFLEIVKQNNKSF